MLCSTIMFLDVTRVPGGFFIKCQGIRIVAVHGSRFRKGIVLLVLVVRSGLLLRIVEALSQVFHLAKYR